MSCKADNEPKPSRCQKGANYGLSIPFIEGLFIFCTVFLKIAAAIAFHSDNTEDFLVYFFYSIQLRLYMPCGCINPSNHNWQLFLQAFE